MSATAGQVVRTCHICEVSCGLALTIDDDKVVSVRGDSDDVYSAGYLCAKGAAIGAIDADEDRLLRPLVRLDGELCETDWATAFARVHELLTPLLTERRSSVALFTGNPSGHNFAGTLLQPELQRALGSESLYSVATVDQMPQVLVAGAMYGTPTSVPIADVDRADVMVIVGANPVVSNGSLGAGPRYPARLRALRSRGGHLVVVDPVATETARIADRHVQIRPGCDVLLLLSMVRELFLRELVHLGAAEGAHGLEAVRAAVEPFAAEAVEDRCGIERGTVVELTERLANAKAAVVYGRTGTTLTPYGTLTSWAIQLLNVLTGNLDRPGGIMFTRPAVGSRSTLPRASRARPIETGHHHSSVRRAPEVLGELPAACLAEDILTTGDGGVRGLITFAGNVARSLPSSTNVTLALESLDALVCIDPYLNETTRHADVILPPASPLTRPHFDIALYAYGIRNVANYSPAVFDPPTGAMSEWDILLRLIGLLEGNGPEADTQGLEERLYSEMADRIERQHGIAADEVLNAGTETHADGLLDMRLRTGPYGDMYGRRPGGLSLALLRRTPHGIDFGPLEPRLAEVLAVSPTAVVELAPTLVLDDLPRAVDLLASAPPVGMTMVGRRGKFSMNSSLHNAPGLAGRDRCTVRIHPDDAAQHGIVDGDATEVRSDRGSIVVPAELTTDMRPGVCSVPHGFGHGSPGTRLSKAASKPGANVNELTDDRLVDHPSGTAALCGVAVTLHRATAVENPLGGPDQAAMRAMTNAVTSRLLGSRRASHGRQ